VILFVRWLAQNNQSIAQLNQIDVVEIFVLNGIAQIGQIAILRGIWV
jgi:hypothetical protein